MKFENEARELLKRDFSLAEFRESQPYKDPAQVDGLIGHLRAAGLN